MAKESHDGLFLVEGGQLRLSGLSISISNDGEIDSEQPDIKLRYDVCPDWLEIAWHHLEANWAAAGKIQEFLLEKNDDAVGEALKEEFTYGMQSIVASCTAMEAFFEVIKDLSGLPPKLTATWREKRTAKYARIAETIRFAFGIDNTSAGKIREFLKESFSFRDKAVHPNQTFVHPAVHPELNKAVDVKFVLFRHHNAKAILGLTLSFVYQLCIYNKIKKEDIQDYSDQLVSKVKPQFERWESKYGKLN